MPITIKFKHISVGLNDSTEPLLKLLKTSLENNGIDENVFEEVGKTNVTGLWGAFLFIMQKVTGALHNRTMVIFPAQNFDVDASAFVLYNAYRLYLNTIIKTMGISAKEAQKNRVKDVSVLLRQLLLRIVVIALRVKIDDVEHGKKVINCLNDFVSSVNESEILLQKNLFSKELTGLGIHLATTHDNWINAFTEMVKIIEDIHRPMTSISEMITFLLVSKLTVARHIILRSKYNVEETTLSDEWIMNTFIDFENEHSTTMKKMNFDDESRYAASSWDAVKPNNTQIEILKKLENKKVPLQKIKELFAFLNRTNLLFQIAIHIEHLVQIGGWIPIINGVIKLDNVKTLFDNYLTAHNAVISISAAELTANRKESAYHQLVRHKDPNIAIRGYSVAVHIALLNNPLIKQQILTFLGRTISQLKSINAEIQSLISSNNDLATTSSTSTATTSKQPVYPAIGKKTSTNLRISDKAISKEGKTMMLDRRSFYKLWEKYKSDNVARSIGRSVFGKMSGDVTSILFEKAMFNEISNEERAKIILEYLENNENENLGFHSFLRKLDNEGILFTQFISEVDNEKNAFAKVFASVAKQALENSEEDSTSKTEEEEPIELKEKEGMEKTFTS